MGIEMTIVSSDALEQVLDRLTSLERKLDAVRMQPVPEWVTVPEMARMVGKSESTINRWIASGQLETRMTAGVRMVRV